MIFSALVQFLSFFGLYSYVKLTCFHCLVYERERTNFVICYFVVVAWYKTNDHFYRWTNSDDALRPYPPGSNTMSLAFGREPCNVYRPLVFHGHLYPRHAVSSPVTSSHSSTHGQLANELTDSDKSYLIQ